MVQPQRALSPEDPTRDKPRTPRRTPRVDDLADISLDAVSESYRRHLRARNRAETTINVYLGCLKDLSRFLAAQGMPTGVRGVRREHIESFLIALTDAGRRPASVAIAFRSLKTFFRWLHEQEEIDANPMARMTAPSVPQESPEVLRREDMAALLRTCSSKSFNDRRDRAMLLLFMATGMRRGELAALTLDALDFERQAIYIGASTTKSKRARWVPLLPMTAEALDRYLRVRQAHRDARLPNLWLGERGPISGNGIRQIVRKRGAQAGIRDLHPHVLRHSYAHHELANGKQEGDVMSIAGWSDRSMLSRYAASTASERALEAARRWSPEDLLR